MYATIKELEDLHLRLGVECIGRAGGGKLHHYILISKKILKFKKEKQIDPERRYIQSKLLLNRQRKKKQVKKPKALAEAL